MDEIDRIQDLEDGKIAQRLSAIQAEFAAEPLGPDCIECGDEIPEERRAALPHAKRCVDCQGKLERHRRFR